MDNVKLRYLCFETVRFFSISILVIALSGAAWGQTVVAEFDAVPPEYRNRFDAKAHMAIGSPYSLESFSAEIKDGQIFEVADQLIEHLRVASWSAGNTERLKVLRELEGFLLDLKYALDDSRIDGELDTGDEQTVFLSRFNSAGRGVDTFREGGGSKSPAFFLGADGLNPNRVVIHSWDSSRNKYVVYIPAAEMLEFRLLMHSLDALLQSQVSIAREVTAGEYRLAARHWERYLQEGYSQFPWESLFNGWILDIPSMGPPARQWILGHPTLGVELSMRKAGDLRVSETLNLEMLGHLWYDEDWSNYWGGSLTVSLRDDMEPGVGVLVHFRRGLNLGVNWHQDSNDPFLFVSVDLLSSVTERKSKYTEEYQRLKAYASTLP